MSIEYSYTLHIKLRRSDTRLSSDSHMSLHTELRTLFVCRFYRHFTPNGVRISKLMPMGRGMSRPYGAIYCVMLAAAVSEIEYQS